MKDDDLTIDLPDIGGVGDIDGLDASLFDIIPEESVAKNEQTRYIKPKIKCTRSDNAGIFEKALDLAKKVKLAKGERYDALVNGDFIFGDFIEAFMTTWNVKATEMTISTLSLNQENIDSLEGLMGHGYIDRLNLIISSYFYNHEAYALIPYLLSHLDKGEQFQLAVADIHTKIVLVHTLGGKKVIIHGSANMRSCGAFEQITIEENPELYDFYDDFHSKIVETYAIIQKNVRAKTLWDAVTKKTFRDL